MKQNVLGQIFEATGLPQEALSGELSPYVEKMGKAEDQLTLDDLRDLMAQYAQEVLLELKREMEKENAALGEL